jgi:hypothetical protein
MPRSFPCPSCGGTIVTFLRWGEKARCGACGAEAVVPEAAVERPGNEGPTLAALGVDGDGVPPESPSSLEPRTGRPPPFMAWSFAASALFLLLMVGVREEFVEIFAGAIFLGWPWSLPLPAVLCSGSVRGVILLAFMFGGGLAQYPVYALFLTRAWRRRSMRRTWIVLVAVHVGAILLAIGLWVVAWPYMD